MVMMIVRRLETVVVIFDHLFVRRRSIIVLDNAVTIRDTCPLLCLLQASELFCLFELLNDYLCEKKKASFCE